MAQFFKLPLLGQTMQEGTILRWLKQEGDAVEASDPIVEIMTDKVNQEVEPLVSGVLRKLLAGEGETIAVGAPIAIIGTADEPLDALLAQLAGAPSAVATPNPQPSTLSPQPPNLSPQPPALTPQPPAPPIQNPKSKIQNQGVSPRARHFSGEAGLDWKSLEVPGTGFEGMIVERDVRAFLEGAERSRPRLTPLAARIAAEHGVAAGPLAEGRGRVRAADIRRAVAARAGEAPAVREWQLAGIRKVIAQRLTASYQGAPHVPLRVEVEMSAAAELRRQLKPEAERFGARLTYTDLIAAALVRGLLAVPAMNATFEGDCVREHGAVHLGVAVALEDGLSVPVIRDAQALSLFDLSAALQERGEAARAGRLPPDAYAGGSFTLSNLGQFGVDSFDPILNPPQVGILGAGRIAERLVARHGAPAVLPTMHLTLVFDHRVVDGAPAARLLAAIKDLLENPARLML